VTVAGADGSGELVPGAVRASSPPPPPPQADSATDAAIAIAAQLAFLTFRKFSKRRTRVSTRIKTTVSTVVPSRQVDFI
jgi:hypothetical protein